MCLNELLKMLEDAGEVNIQLAEHKLTKDSSGNFSVESLGDVAFVLDTPKPKKKKAKVTWQFLVKFKVLPRMFRMAKNKTDANVSVPTDSYKNFAADI
jgi:hypothetical protein